jgi:hypothetical protein
MITDEEIKKLALSIWEEEGRPTGKDVEHYFRAKKILEEREANRIIELAPVPPVVELPQPPKKVPLPLFPVKRSIRERHKKK